MHRNAVFGEGGKVSQTTATYGITICMCLLFLASVPALFGPVLFTDFSKTHFGHPQV